MRSVCESNRGKNLRKTYSEQAAQLETEVSGAHRRDGCTENHQGPGLKSIENQAVVAFGYSTIALRSRHPWFT
ncbi:MAG: hypothetical protein CMM01_09070 [Rhodopirellula sp.]|nr:hypothetical protein [Rhodopirellula sp.]